MTEPGVVFTKDWVVDFVLNVAGYTTDRDLTSGCVVEPSCGDGAFLGRVVSRLCECAVTAGALSAERLVSCIRAYDVDSASVLASRATVRQVLESFGMSPADSERLAGIWVIQGDFLLSEVPPARWVVGNPPYVRSSLIPREQRVAYGRVLPCVTMGSDLYVGFFEKGLEALEENGALCFICADRWLQNRYGSRLRAFVSEGYSLDVHIRMHGVDAFEEDVSAYPGIVSTCTSGCTASMHSRRMSRRTRQSRSSEGVLAGPCAIWSAGPASPWMTCVTPRSGSLLERERTVPRMPRQTLSRPSMELSQYRLRLLTG